MRRMAAGLVLIMTLLAGAGITSATTPTAQQRARDAAVAWLSAQVTPAGALESPYTGNPSPGITAQAVLGLAAAGANPTLIDSMIGYLKANIGDFVAPGGGADDPGALSWLILDAVATGEDPSNFGGVDLPARLEATRRSTGEVGLFGAADPTYDGAFRQGLSLIALHAVGIDDAVGADWLRGQQCADGSFVAYRIDTSVACAPVDPSTFSGADTNSTAFAAIALALNGDRTDADRALTWLAGVRTVDGGFAYLGSSTQAMDANSTGLVLLAFTTIDGEPDEASVQALESLQVPQSGDPVERGGIAFQPQGDALVPDLMATVQALMGLAGKPLPIVPEVVEPTTTGPTHPSSTVPTVTSVQPRHPITATSAQPIVATPTFTG